MVPSRVHLRFWVNMLAILNSKWLTVKLSKNIFSQIFFQICSLFLHELHTIEFQKSMNNVLMYQPNVGHFEFKTADTEVVQKCNLAIFLKFVVYFCMNCILLDLRCQRLLYQSNVSHLEFKMAEPQIIKKCRIIITCIFYH